MSRQEGYNNEYQMDNLDTDLDALELDSPPSPPLHVSENEEGQEREDDDHQPRTPYYDYACTRPARD
jgi:hypothetical protein